MRIQTFVIINAIHHLIGCTRTCSRLDQIQFSLDIPEKRFGKTHKALHKVTKYTYEVVQQLEVTSVSWKSTYCPVVEAGPFEDCKEVIQTYSSLSEAIESFTKRNKTSVPDHCDEGHCDGISEHDCLYPKELYWVEYGYKAQGKLSGSWLHHRCVREVSTNMDLAEVLVEFVTPHLKKLSLPDRGSCFSDQDAQGCLLTPSEIIQTRNLKWKTESDSSFPCLERDGETICYDSDSKVQFFWSPDKCSRLPGVLYCGKQVSEKGDRADAKDAVITLEVVDELTYQLQYEALELQYDMTILQEQVTQLKYLVKSIILHSYKITSDPLQWLTGIGIDRPTLEGDILTGAVCTAGFPNGLPRKSSNLSSPVKHIFGENESLLDYEQIRVQIPFLKKAPLTNAHLLNFSHFKHGDASFVNVSGLMDSKFLENFFSFFHYISGMLPWVNFVLIFFVAMRR